MNGEMSVVRNIFVGQSAHAFLLFSLGVCILLAAQLPGFFDGELAGLSTQVWFVLVVANAVAHQLYVWFCWRVELHAHGLTRVFGRLAFPVYAIFFAVLILARPVLMTLLSISNAGTLPIGEEVSRVVAFIMVVPVAYLAWSVRRYFGIARAFGIDHFDPAYRSLPIVRGGIFGVTPNAMYTFGFLFLWIPAIYFRSISGIVAAAFSHAYIWVHYLTTEKPDMEFIYGRQASG
ncbi:MAG: methyltransferase [Gammaproteobacteria bacterium]